MKVGDQVWYVPSDQRHGNGSLATITKIGRKYFYINKGDAYDIKCSTWNYDSYAIGKVEDWPYGAIYSSEKDYLDKVEWDRIELRYMALTREQKDKIVAIVKGG